MIAVAHPFKVDCHVKAHTHTHTHWHISSRLDSIGDALSMPANGPSLCTDATAAALRAVALACWPLITWIHLQLEQDVCLGAR